MDNREYKERARLAVTQYMDDIRKISLVDEKEQQSLQKEFGLRVCTDRRVYFLTTLATARLTHFQYSKKLEEVLKSEEEKENPPSKQELDFLQVAFDAMCQGDEVLYEDYLESAWNSYQLRRRSVH